MLETIGVENVGKIIPSEDEQKPQDPVFENMNLLNGKPVKAFMFQDHEAHIKVHMNAMQDPYIQDILQNNPAAPGMEAAAQAHIAEHVAFLYRSKLEEQLGVPLPASEEDEPLPNDVEVQLSRLVADASEQLLQQNQSRMAQEQAQEQAQDPVIQMQQAELQLKNAELQRKMAKDQLDARIKEAQVQVESERIDSQERQTAAKILADAENKKEENRVKEVVEGVRLVGKIDVPPASGE